jgi:4-amino-4-deoxy-L-arabinose transferase-like glycosyltransferase
MTQVRFWRTIFVLGIMLYLLLSGAMSYTKRPWADEAWLANVSWSMLHNGNTGISVLDPRGNANMMGREFPQIDKHYYIWIPVHEAAYAVWYKIAGFHLLSMRGFSMVWGLVALLAWFSIVRELTGNLLAAALAVVFIGTDFAFVDASADGRMDIMVAALSSSALAVYLRLRERALNAALVLSQALAVAAGLTHPMGAIGFVSLLFLTLCLDRPSIGLRQVTLAFAVYLMGVAVAAAYILPGLDLFRAQFPGALTGRLGAVESPGNTFLQEFTVKYRSLYLPPYTSGLAYSRLLIPLIYGMGLASLLSMRSARTRPGYRLFLGLAAVAFVAMAILDSGKLYYYLVHSTPFWAVALALWVAESWQRRGLWRFVSCSAAAGIVLLHLGWNATLVRRDVYHNSFLPMAHFVQGKIESNRGKPYIVTSSAELGFVIGFHEPLVDDALLGFAGRKHPNLFVFEERTYGSHYPGFERHRPEIAAHIRRLREEFQEVYTDGYYRVYERKED